MSKLPLLKLTLSLELKHRKFYVLLSFLLFIIFCGFTYLILETGSTFLLVIYTLIVIISPILYFIDYKIYFKFEDIYFIQKDSNYSSNEVIYINIGSIDLKEVVYNDNEESECLAYIIKSKSDDILTSIPLKYVNEKMCNRIFEEIRSRNPEVKITKDVQSFINQTGKYEHVEVV